MKRLVYPLLIPGVLLLAGCGGALIGTKTEPANVPVESATQVANQPFSYDDYALVLSDHVDSEGQVDYDALKENRQPLDNFNQSLAVLSPDTFATWTDEEKIAFWVNIYNSLTLQAIIDNYPTESIRNIPGVWKRLQFNVMGQNMTLDQIEHEVIRKEFNEPRIHMAIVCASIGCPVLRQEPFVGEELDAQLDDQTEQFLALDRNFKIDKDNNRVEVSSIFKWFGQDFEPTYGVENKFAGNDKEKAVLNFVSQYLDPENQAYLTAGDYRVGYLDYDWSLNEQL
ncbi:MAG: DUF547 domain-containing protein [Microcoleaceae cyanobacterium]